MIKTQGAVAKFAVIKVILFNKNHLGNGVSPYALFF
jgi:hypothetical protein